MIKRESDEDYQQRMNRLAIRVGEVLDGEDYLDTATVMAGLSAFAIVSSSSSIKQREKLLKEIVEFMYRQIQKDLPRDH